MQSDSSARTSFFDDDDLNLKVEFVKPGKSHSKYLILSPGAKSSLTRADTSEKGFYVLFERILAYYEVPILSNLALSHIEPKFQNSSFRLGSRPLKTKRPSP